MEEDKGCNLIHFPMLSLLMLGQGFVRRSQAIKKRMGMEWSSLYISSSLRSVPLCLFPLSSLSPSLTSGIAQSTLARILTCGKPEGPH